MMRKILLLLLLCNAALAQQTDSVHMFAYFRQNGEDGLHLAYSRDGYTWSALKGDSSFLTPTAGKDKLMRDPCIIRGADGKFHMVWTVSWNEQSIGYASSEDLVHWSPQKDIPVMAHEPGARNCWAPEVTYDPAKKEYMIYWATTIPGRFKEGDTAGDDKYNHRMYYVTTKDFSTFSKTRLLYDHKFNVIDASILRNGKEYIMFMKDETKTPPQKNIRIATAGKLTGPYTKPSAPITGNYWAEGPTALKIRDTWIVYFDKYTQHKYGAVASTDLVNWTDVSDRLVMPDGIRHGTAFTISAAEFNRLAGLTGYTAAPDLSWTKRVGAKSFPAAQKIFMANDYGAVSDTTTMNTAFIQRAIDDCAAKGGGTVVLKPGTYVTGSLFIKSNVNFRIDDDVTLLGSQDFKDYPEIDTRIAGIEMKWPAAMINMLNVKNAALIGTGTINARGRFCWDKYWKMRKEDYEPRGLRWIVDYDAKRVRTVLVQHSEDITLKGITIKNAGFWTVQLLYSARITADGLVIRNNEDGKGPSTDGIDVDSSTWVLIENCDIDCNDDDFCLKAGRDWDGLRVNRPTEYVVIRKCIARRGGGLLTLGSETSGGIRHVLAEDLIGKGTGNGFHIKSAITRGGIVEDIHFRNITLDSVGNAFHFTMNWNPSYSYSRLPDNIHPDSIPSHWKTMLKKVEPAEKGIPHFRNIYISNIKASGVKRIISAKGMPESPLENFHFTDVHIEGNTKGEIEFDKGWQFIRSSFTAK